LKKQIIELSIEAYRPEYANIVSEAELQVIGLFLTEFLIEMLAHLDQDKE
jgi:hypothetical protein